MEIWAIVVLVVGTNLGTALIALLGNKMQLDNAEKRLEKQLKAQREENQHERSWIVRSQPLLKMRAEIARMAQKLEASIDLATRFDDKGTPESDKMFEAIGKAVQEWGDYINSGEFHQTLHMQYDYKLKVEANKIFLDYDSGYESMRTSWNSKNRGEVIREAEDVIKRNAVRISEVQLKINGMLEEL
jgi:hypothetical protein